MLIRLLLLVGVLELNKHLIQAKAIHGTSTDLVLRKSEKDEGIQSRDKRGLFSVIVYGTSLATRATSLGMSLSAALSGGCDPVSGYKSICEDRDAIESMDQEIQVLKDQYDREYLKNKKEFLDLRTASTNNAYIEFYVNETVQKVEEMSDLQQKAFDILQVELPKLFQMFEASQNFTSEDYLQALIGQLEVSLNDIKTMVQQQTKNQLIGLGVQLLVEGLLNKFSKSYTNVQNQILKAEAEDIFGTAVMTTIFTADPEEAAIILDPNHARYEEVMQKHGLDPEAAKRTFKDKLKLTGKTFKGMLQNTKKYFSDTKTSFGKWNRIKTWEGFKGKFKNSFKKPLAKLSMVKAFVTNSQSRKFVVKNFKLGWSQGLMTGIGAIFDVIQIAVSKSEWYKVSVEISKARKDYEIYLANLTAEVASLEPERQKMQEGWTNLTSAFKGLSEAFKEIITHGNNNSEFNDVFGLSGLPVSTQSSIFTIDFDAVTKDSLLGSQDSVIAFLRDINFNLTEINDEFRARNILYESIRLQTNETDSVKTILESLKNVYGFSPSQVVKNFGSQLAKKDIACSVAKIRIDLDEYDFYPLTPFRPHCDVSDAQFNDFDNAARQQQNMVLLRETVKDQININDQQSVSALLAAAQNAYSKLNDPEIQAFGNTITEQLVVCTISEQFPEKQDYDFYSLSPFRPDCSGVTAEDFAIMKENSEKRKTLAKEVEASLNVCDSFNFCPCPSMLAQNNNASEADIIAVIRYLQPNRTQYCGTTGCQCVDL